MIVEGEPPPMTHTGLLASFPTPWSAPVFIRCSHRVCHGMPAEQYHRNPQRKRYLLAVLFNAPTTISNHYRTDQPRYVRRRLVAAAATENADFAMTSCLHYGS